LAAKNARQTLLHGKIRDLLTYVYAGSGWPGPGR
jgi:hypothetical protein